MRQAIVRRVDANNTRLDHSHVHVEESERRDIEQDDEEELPDKGPLVRIIEIAVVSEHFNELASMVVHRLRQNKDQLCQ